MARTAAFEKAVVKALAWIAGAITMVFVVMLLLFLVELLKGVELTLVTGFLVFFAVIVLPLFLALFFYVKEKVEEELEKG
uniref:Uncharacterized protein n=1 Tax=Thermofilum pendens TaxID=2269 RepID=A0A7C1P1D7_THEPE